IKKLASKFWYALLVAFCMKIGSYFERFVIITTSFHRDYYTENGNTELIDSFSFGIGMIFLQAIIITILTLWVFELIKRKTIHNSRSPALRSLPASDIKYKTPLSEVYPGRFTNPLSEVS